MSHDRSTRLVSPIAALPPKRSSARTAGPTLRALRGTVLWVAALPAAALASDVHVVDAAGGGAHTTIQAAVQAAQDGDVILVRAGAYAGDVTLGASSLVLVGEGAPQVLGHVLVQNLDSDDTLAMSGFVVSPPRGTFPFAFYRGAVDVRQCRGPVRLQDCVLRGADEAGVGPLPDHAPSLFVADGGPGLYAEMSHDVALVDSQAFGGVGALGVVAVSGWGGEAVFALDVAHLTVARSVVRGGRGGDGDDPGDGGAGARIFGGTTLHLAYAALFGGDAGCWAGFMSSPGWMVDGGDGLVRGAGTHTWDFDGVFGGGADASGSCAPTPAGGAPGQAHGGSGAMVSSTGFPNTLHAPALVREGQAWSLEVVATAGELASVPASSATAFGFRPRLEQPRLIAAPGLLMAAPPQVIPPTERLLLLQPPATLPLGLDADVRWFQAAVGPLGGPATWGSARFVVLLDAAL
ncbi:MAG: hypothetical protein R3F49_02575 [Planctomycetota bacterium]